MSELNITVESMKRVELVTVVGRIDSSTAQQFDNQLKELFNANKHSLALNLAGVTYTSSAGLRSLVSAMKECKKNSGKIVLSAPSERVEEVLQLAGLNSLFEIHADDTAAVGSF